MGRFGDEGALVVERYDRLRIGPYPHWVRLHQEDGCQALATAARQVRFAPLYDLTSALPHAARGPRPLKLAMKLGDEYGIGPTAKRQFEGLALSMRLEPERTLERARALAERLLACTPALVTRAKEQGLTHPMVDRLRDALLVHGERCLKALAS